MGKVIVADEEDLRRIVREELERAGAVGGEYLSFEKAAAKLGVDESTIRRYVRRGVLKVYHLEGLRRIDARELELAMKAGRRTDAGDDQDVGLDDAILRSLPGGRR